mmetsp:Transcript_99683/g.282088  ORF Transcript_99683/g.282088 Transcript_99683/m.282088 type:complete len:261 (+) Transcript_99683:424-1206(+)
MAAWSLAARLSVWRRVRTRTSAMLAACWWGSRVSKVQWPSACSRWKGPSACLSPRLPPSKWALRSIAVVPEMHSSKTIVARTSTGCSTFISHAGSRGSRRCRMTSLTPPFAARSAARHFCGFRVSDSLPTRMRRHPSYSAGPSTMCTSSPLSCSVICSRLLEVWFPWNSRQMTATTLPSSFSVIFSTVHFRCSVQKERVAPPSTETVGCCSRYLSCLTRRSGSASSSASRRATNSPRQRGQASDSAPETPSCAMFSMTLT